MATEARRKAGRHRAREPHHTRALRYFDEVARTGSIREASARLHVAPSAISRQIAKLEDEAGETLFDRTVQGMRLTRAGRTYRSYVLSVTMAGRRLNSQLDDLRGLKTGSVRIVSIEGLVAPLVSRTISEFRREYPDVQFTIEIVGATDVIRRLSTGSADVGVAFNAPTEVGIEYLLRVPDPIMAVAAPTGSVISSARLSLAEALAFPFAVPVVGFGMRLLVDQACREQGIPLPPAALETNSIEAMRSFARNGDGVSLLHRMAVESELVEGSLRAIDIESEALRSGTVDLCVHSEYHLPVGARIFADFLRRKLGDGTADTPMTEEQD